MFSSQLCEILKREGMDIVGYTVDNAYKDGDFFENLPVLSFEDLEKFVDITDIEIALTIGYNHMNDVRKLKHLECKRRGIKLFTFISRESNVYTDEIGEGSIVMPGAYVGPYSKLGVCCVLWPGSVLAHHNILGDYNWVAPSSCFGGGSSSGKNCFFGLGSTVRNGINIADYTFIGAQTYICKDSFSNGVYLGVPAKQMTEMNSIEIVTRV